MDHAALRPGQWNCRCSWVGHQERPELSSIACSERISASRAFRSGPGRPVSPVTSDQGTHVDRFCRDFGSGRRAAVGRM